MPNPTHVRLAATAVRLIKKNGRDMQLVSIENTGPSYDPEQTEVSTGVVGVQTNYDTAEVNGSLVQSDDIKFLIDTNKAIETDMRIRDDGVDYSIVNRLLIKPGETSMIYKVQARI